jgi:hypothetical protein
MRSEEWFSNNKQKIVLGMSNILRDFLSVYNLPSEVFYQHAKFGRSRCGGMEMCKEQATRHRRFFVGKGNGK